MSIEQEFFNELSDKLEDLFIKGEKCQCGNRLHCRSKALVLNAYANLLFQRKVGEAHQKGFNEGLNTKVVGSTKVKSKTTHDRGGGLADLI